MGYKNIREQPSLGETDMSTKHTQGTDTLIKPGWNIWVIANPQGLSSGVPNRAVHAGFTPQERNDPQVIYADINTSQHQPDYRKVMANFRGSMAGDIFTTSWI